MRKIGIWGEGLLGCGKFETMEKLNDYFDLIGGSFGHSYVNKIPREKDDNANTYNSKLDVENIICNDQLNNGWKISLSVDVSYLLADVNLIIRVKGEFNIHDKLKELAVNMLSEEAITLIEHLFFYCRKEALIEIGKAADLNLDLINMYESDKKRMGFVRGNILVQLTRFASRRGGF